MYLYQFTHTVLTSIITYFFICLTLETLFKILNGNTDQELMYMYMSKILLSNITGTKNYMVNKICPLFIYKYL